MLKRFIILGLLFLSGFVFASEPVLKGYDEYQIPSGYHIPIMALQEFSTAYTEEGDELNFITTNDIFLFDKKVEVVLLSYLVQYHLYWKIFLRRCCAEYFRRHHNRHLQP